MRNGLEDICGDGGGQFGCSSSDFIGIHCACFSMVSGVSFFSFCFRNFDFIGLKFVLLKRWKLGSHFFRITLLVLTSSLALN